jgi:hypothetical protein
MQDDQLGQIAWQDRVGTTIVVTELDQSSPIVKGFDDRADLSARKTFDVVQQRYNIERSSRHISIRHQSTQHVTSQTPGWPIFAIHSVLITETRSCRTTVMSARHRVPKLSAPTCSISAVPPANS